MRRAVYLMTAAAVALGVQLGGPVVAQPGQPVGPVVSAPAAAAETTTVLGWSVATAAVRPYGALWVPVQVQTGSGFVARKAQVQRRKAGTTAWSVVSTEWTASDGRYTARLSAPAGVWQFRLVVLESPTAAARETLARTVSVMRAETISSGDSHTCALDTSGKAWCWGLDAYGQLGNGPADTSVKGAPVPVAGGHTFATISAGMWHTCGVDTEGKAWCWGYDFFGQVGDGGLNRANKHAPAAVLGSHVFAIISAYWNTCAVDTGGKAWCWGPDGNGQAGDGGADQTAKHLPVAVAGGRAFSSISAGNRHACGLDLAGKAWCWGFDGLGEVGDGNDNQRNKYAPVAVAGNRAYTTIHVGGGHTCGVATSGEAWCWGEGDVGQLGSGATAGPYTDSPVAVAGSHTYRTVSAGLSYTCGVDTGGKPRCWGSDDWGQLGNGSGGDQDEDKFRPVPVVGIDIMTTLSAGQSHTCGLDNGGHGWCWGYDSYYGAPTAPSPVAVAGGHVFRQPNW